MKILYTATVLSHVCQFHLPHMRAFRERGHEVWVAARDNLAEKGGLALRHCDRFVEIPFRRTPLHPGNLVACVRLRRLLGEERFDVVVCNTPAAGVVTRLAAVRARRGGTRVVYVAHGFHFYEGAPLLNWLLYYPVERALAPLCDALVTITREDYALARGRFGTRVRHIHGIGVDGGRYRPVPADERALLRRENGLSDSDYAVLCTGELNRNKDQRTLVLAADRLRDRMPNLKVLLAGNGPEEGRLRALVHGRDLDGVVRLLGYRTDLGRLVPAVDLVVSCSRREGLPLNVLEAMLCGTPLVVSDNRGNRELVRHGSNGLVFAPGDAAALAEDVLAMSRADASSYVAEGIAVAEDYVVDNVNGELSSIIAEVTRQP